MFTCKVVWGLKISLCIRSESRMPNVKNDFGFLKSPYLRGGDVLSHSSIMLSPYMTRVTRKQTLRSLSSHPEKDWRAGALQILLWVWHRLQNIIYEHSRVIFYSRCHIQRRIGGAPARQSFFGYDNDKDLKVCFLVIYPHTQIKSWSATAQG